MLSGSPESFSRGSCISHRVEATAKKYIIRACCGRTFALATLTRVFRLVSQLLPLQFLPLSRRWSDAIGGDDALATNADHGYFSESSIIPSQFFKSWPRRIAIFRK